MLKKVGVAVMASAASLVVLSPVAFAGDTGYGDAVKGDRVDGHHVGHDGHDGDHDGHHHGHPAIDKDSHGALVSGLNGNNVNVPIQACNNNINAVGVQGSDIVGALGLLGGANAQAANPDSCSQTAGAGDSVS